MIFGIVQTVYTSQAGSKDEYVDLLNIVLNIAMLLSVFNIWYFIWRYHIASIELKEFVIKVPDKKRKRVFIICLIIFCVDMLGLLIYSLKIDLV
jgi:accessory gene regulator protein AgrB